MRRQLPMLILALLVWCAVAGDPVSAQRVSAPALTISEQYLFDALNQERASAGLQALVWNPALASAARIHAGRMAAKSEISHQFAGEPALSARISSSGAHVSAIAENVAVAPTAVSLHDAWMHSAGHRANILDSNFTSVGIAIVARGQDLWAVQDFARDVQSLSLEDQEERVESLLNAAGVATVATSADARSTCLMSSGYAGKRRPRFVMRYSSADLSRLPDRLTTLLATRSYKEANVGACSEAKQGAFTTYSIAVLLFSE